MALSQAASSLLCQCEVLPLLQISFVYIINPEHILYSKSKWSQEVSCAIAIPNCIPQSKNVSCWWCKYTKCPRASTHFFHCIKTTLNVSSLNVNHIYIIVTIVMTTKISSSGAQLLLQRELLLEHDNVRKLVPQAKISNR